MNSSSIILFVGPTLHGLPAELLRSAQLILIPPVKRGDIDRLIHAHPPGNIAIVDGIFHNHPSVGHREIRQAIERGWEVWGLSSMGAIRACEMQAFGMKGFGEVYERYAADEDFTDDEVTLLHEPDEPFHPLSEPLVHIRAILHALVTEHSMRDERAREVIGHLKEVWFGYRTLSRLRELIREHSPESVEALEDRLRQIDRYRTKTVDLRRFIQQQPWRAL